MPLSLKRLDPKDSLIGWISYIGLACILLSLCGVLLNNLLLVVAPLFVIVVSLAILDFRWLFLVLISLIPLSIEVELPGGFGTDLPTEPLMLLLMGIALVVLLRRAHQINAQLLLNPLSLLLLFHYSWLWITSFFSDNVFVSVKFCLAKTWYILVFYILGIIILRNTNFQKKVFQVCGISMFLVTSIILVRHGLEGFSFATINTVVVPFFRNHVNSAATMVAFVPFAVYLMLTSKEFISWAWWLTVIVVLLGGIYFSFTRAAHLSLLIALGAAFVIYNGWMKYAIGISAIALVLIFSSLMERNSYLDYAPDFETTVSHQEFGDLISATSQGKDISTMERVYRWVAGYQMAQKQPYMGFGPGNFYNYYKSYTVTNFKTYVSENPEKSGIHSYYFMTIVEQGLIGLAIFLSLIIFALLKFEHVWHRLESHNDKVILMCTAASFVMILAFQLINDLIETDKMGPFFFLCLAILFNYDLKQKGQKVILEDK